MGPKHAYFIGENRGVFGLRPDRDGPPAPGTPWGLADNWRKALTDSSLFWAIFSAGPDIGITVAPDWSI